MRRTWRVAISVVYSPSMLFHHKTKKFLKVVWVVVAVLVIVSMIVLYIPLVY